MEKKKEEKLIKFIQFILKKTRGVNKEYINFKNRNKFYVNIDITGMLRTALHECWQVKIIGFNGKNDRIPYSFKSVGMQKKQTHVEHAVPVGVICKILINEFSNDEVEDIYFIKNFLINYFRLMRVTKEEHKNLPSNCMPDFWSWKDNSNPWQRYINSSLESHYYRFKIDKNGDFILGTDKFPELDFLQIDPC